jgi:hypothetical protein
MSRLVPNAQANPSDWACTARHFSTPSVLQLAQRRRNELLGTARGKSRIKFNGKLIQYMYILTYNNTTKCPPSPYPAMMINVKQCMVGHIADVQSAGWLDIHFSEWNFLRISCATCREKCHRVAKHGDKSDKPAQWTSYIYFFLLLLLLFQWWCQKEERLVRTSYTLMLCSPTQNFEQTHIQNPATRCSFSTHNIS